MVTTNLVAPDGGYGWVIVFSFALSNIITIPIMQGFGLIFKDKFKDLGFSAADIAFIMNCSSTISMFCGIFNAPLLKKFGYRTVSFMSATLTVVGVFMTGFANSFFEYILTYSVITSYGMGMGMSSFSLALNSFFRKNRTKAVGYAMAFCGIGPIIMPQVLSFLLWQYGVTGTLTVVAGIACHIYIAALLLQPVRWHMKEVVVEDEPENEKLFEQENKNIKTNLSRSFAASKLSLDEQIEVEAIYSIDPTLGGSVLSLYSDFPQRSMSVSSRRKSVRSKASLREEDEKDENNVDVELGVTLVNVEEQKKADLSSDKEAQMNLTIWRKIGNFLVEMFDLTLLQDPTFVNIMIGMSFAVFAEVNFSLLTPFVMQDFGLDTQQIAAFMSVVSIADICFRFIAPYVSEFFKKPTRIMYLWALVLLILARSSLLFTSHFYGLLGCAYFLGIAKGFTTVYWSLVIPDYVPIERLAGAQGMQSTFNSLFMWVGGSFLGFIRDALGSFKYCIIVINVMSFISIMLWTIELTYKRFKSKRSTLDTRNTK